MSNFVQLTQTDCTYLLDLIKDMDNDTAYTAKQRAFTVPKLIKIQSDPRSARLAFQDVEYLLDLIEDDELTETEQQRYMTKTKLEEIQSLQESRFNETREIELQRDARRRRRLEGENIQVSDINKLQAKYQRQEVK